MSDIFLFLLCYFYNPNLMAHDGPAYPILVDHKISASNQVSIWTDPDVEQGTFTFYVEGKMVNELSIGLSASPSNDIKKVLKSTAKLSEKNEERSIYTAILPFTEAMVWNVTFNLGEATPAMTLPVDVTPPGPSKGEFVLYFLPFLALGLIWVKVIITKNKKSS